MAVIFKTAKKGSKKIAGHPRTVEMCEYLGITKKELDKLHKLKIGPVRIPLINGYCYNSQHVEEWVRLGRPDKLIDILGC